MGSARPTGRQLLHSLGRCSTAENSARSSSRCGGQMPGSSGARACRHAGIPDVQRMLLHYNHQPYVIQLVAEERCSGSSPPRVSPGFAHATAVANRDV